MSDAVISPLVGAVVAEHANLALRVEFFATQDRYRHAIMIADGRVEAGRPTSTALLVSSAAAADPCWPASPPWQDVQWDEPRAGNPDVEHRLALGVGMSGSSHWSASVSASADGPEGSGLRIVFDIACRCKETPLWLGSTYELCDGSVVAGQGGQLEIVDGRHRCRLRTVATDQGDGSRVAVAGRDITICPTTRFAKPPQTVRWCYALELVASHA